MYDPAFYDLIAQGCRDSAAVVAPIVHELVQPATVLDVGCGQGWWAKAFKDLGCQVYGADGGYVDQSKLAIDPAEFIAVDLAQSFRVHLKDAASVSDFDMVVSLEVAEHLPPEAARRFIDDLCAHAPVVLFSAAIPGQGGVGHLNEQWPSYWVDLFEDHGYSVSGALRWKIWDNPQVENWYCQNLLLAVNERRMMNVLAEKWTVTDELYEVLHGPLSAPWPVVHPVLWDSRR